MNWENFFLKFFRNVILGIIFGAVALGLFGFMLAGKEGAINGVYWGAIFGLIGGFFSGITIFAIFRGQPGNYQDIPEHNWFVIKDEHERPKD